MVDGLTAWQSGTLATPLREGGSEGALSIPDHAIDAGDFAQPTPLGGRLSIPNTQLDTVGRTPPPHSQSTARRATTPSSEIEIIIEPYSLLACSHCVIES